MGCTMSNYLTLQLHLPLVFQFNLLETEIIIFLPLVPSCFPKTVQILQTSLLVSQLCLLFEYMRRGGDQKQTDKQK